MQTIFLALLLAAVFGLFVPTAQTRLRGVLHGSPGTVWAVPFLLAGVFAAAAVVAGAFSWQLTGMVLLYAAAPVACASGCSDRQTLTWFTKLCAAALAYIPR